MKKMRLPIIIILIGLALAIGSCFLTGMLIEPSIKEYDFDYSVTYKINGDTKTYNGIYRCTFDGYDNSGFFISREYMGEYVQDKNHTREHYDLIAEKDGYELHLVTELDESYLMGDFDPYRYVRGNTDPYFIAYDEDGCAADPVEVFNAEIVSWEYPEPIDNSFKPAGFSILYPGSMLAMIIVGALAIIACAIFVRREKDVKYGVIDWISFAFNFIVGFIAIPIIAFLVWIMQITVSTEGLTYQMFLCVPAVTAFSIAASIALRRKGIRLVGALIQFAGPLFFTAFILCEAIISNFFF